MSMDKESFDGMSSSFQSEIKLWNEKILELSKAMMSHVPENNKASESEDVNNKLTVYAQQAIEESQGPIEPDKLLTFILSEYSGRKTKKNLLQDIRKHSFDIDGVREQLSKISEIVKKHMEHLQKMKQMDASFIKKLEKIDRTINEELENESKSKTVQSSLYDFFSAENAPSKDKVHNTRNDMRKNSQKRSTLDHSSSSSSQTDQQSEKRNGKRKSTNDDSRNTNKKINGTRNNKQRSSSTLNARDSKHPTEAVLQATESGDIEPMIISESDDSQPTEPMSVEEAEGSSSQNTEPMSISSYGSSSSQTDAESIDDSQERIGKKKSSSNQSRTPLQGLEENAFMSRKKEETVPENRFYMRGGPLVAKKGNDHARNHASSESSESDDDDDRGISNKNIRLRGKPFR